MLSVSGATIVTPSPAKKKLSLGDYMSRRKESATPSIEKPSLNLPAAFDIEKERRSSESKPEADVARKDSASTIDTTKARAADNEQVVEDTPMSDPIDTAPTKPDNAQHSSANAASTEVQSVLSSLQQMHGKQGLRHL